MSALFTSKRIARTCSYLNETHLCSYFWKPCLYSDFLQGVTITLLRINMLAHLYWCSDHNFLKLIFNSVVWLGGNKDGKLSSGHKKAGDDGMEMSQVRCPEAWRKGALDSLGMGCLKPPWSCPLRNLEGLGFAEMGGRVWGGGQEGAPERRHPLDSIQQVTYFKKGWVEDETQVSLGGSDHALATATPHT